MDPSKELEDRLREFACTGDIDGVRTLVEQGANVNAQHKINGWTALHWAAKRGHVQLVSFLLNHGANKNLMTSKDEDPLLLATNPNIRAILGGEPSGDSSLSSEESVIIPNYLVNPPFPYASQPQLNPVKRESPVNLSMNSIEHRQSPSPAPAQRSTSSAVCSSDENDLVLKVRVANAAEKDFIEIELNKNNLTFDALLTITCKELEVNRGLLQKVRKLPDTIVRKDKDVKRLREFQELELVLSNRAVSESSRNYGPSGVPSVSPRHVDVVY